MYSQVAMMWQVPRQHRRLVSSLAAPAARFLHRCSSKNPRTRLPRRERRPATDDWLDPWKNLSALNAN